MQQTHKVREKSPFCDRSWLWPAHSQSAPFCCIFVKSLYTQYVSRFSAFQACSNLSCAQKAYKLWASKLEILNYWEASREKTIVVERCYDHCINNILSWLTFSQDSSHPYQVLILFVTTTGRTDISESMFSILYPEFCRSDHLFHSSHSCEISSTLPQIWMPCIIGRVGH